MENKINNLIASIDMALDIYSNGGTEKIDYLDNKYIMGMIEALNIVTNKTYTIRNYHVVDISILR